MDKRFLANGQEVGLIQTCYEYLNDYSREYHLVRKIEGVTETENTQIMNTYGEIEIYQGDLYYKLTDTPAYKAPAIKQEEIASLEKSIENLNNAKKQLEKEIDILKNGKRQTFAEMGCPFVIGDIFYQIDYDNRIIEETVSKIVLCKSSSGKTQWEFYYGRNENYLGLVRENGDVEFRLHKTKIEAEEDLKKRIIDREALAKKEKEKEIARAKKILEENENS